MNAQTDRPAPADAAAFSGRHVHFVGVGGSGMSGLARVLIDAGAIVTGSDTKPNPQTEDLVARGARVSFEQRGELIGERTQLVVRTAAVRDENAEMTVAGRLGIPTLKYAELLGQVMAGRFGVAVGGTHGKSTTTAMLCHALVGCGLDPSFVVGGNVPQLGGGSRSGRGPHFVAEACEYDRSFHQLRPRVAILNNIEAEHLDCYGTLDGVIASFRAFASLVPAEGGLILARGDDANVARAVDGIGRKVETFGFGDADDWRIVPTDVVGGCHGGDVYRRGTKVATLRPAIPGRHNLLNATVALAAAVHCGADPFAAAAALGTFTGVERRMTEMGRLASGAVVVDDYGHHPTEIRVTLGALRQKYQPKRLICVFQPHQYSRTRLLIDEFAGCFDDADRVIVPDIYSVRDSAEDRAAVDSATLVDRVNRRTPGRAAHVARLDDIVTQLRAEARAGDVIVTMGAGDVNDVARRLVGA